MTGALRCGSRLCRQLESSSTTGKGSNSLGAGAVIGILLGVGLFVCLVVGAIFTLCYCDLCPKKCEEAAAAAVQAPVEEEAAERVAASDAYYGRVGSSSQVITDEARTPSDVPATIGILLEAPSTPTTPTISTRTEYVEVVFGLVGPQTHSAANPFAAPRHVAAEDTATLEAAKPEVSFGP